MPSPTKSNCIFKNKRWKARRHKYINLLNNARLELVTLCFNKVITTDQSNRDCLGLCLHALKRSTKDVRIVQNVIYKDPPSHPSSQSACHLVHFISSWTGLSGPQFQSSPRPSPTWSANTDLIHYASQFSFSFWLALPWMPISYSLKSKNILNASQQMRPTDFQGILSIRGGMFNRLVRHLRNIRGSITTVASSTFLGMTISHTQWENGSLIDRGMRLDCIQPVD